MNAPRWDEALRAARDDRPAPLDVSADVATRVSALPTPTAERPLLRWLRRWDVDPSLAAAAGVSLAAAAAALVLAAPWLAWLLDPLALWAAR